MRSFRTWLGSVTLLSGVMLALIQARPSRMSASESSGKGKTDRVALSQILPALNGSRLKVTVVEVTYEPGGSSPPHSHPCPVIVYVLDGALRTQVNGETEAIYRAGESFYEAPNGIHQISANASQTAPVKFLAYFVCDHEGALSVAPPRSGPPKEDSHER